MIIYDKDWLNEQQTWLSLRYCWLFLRWVNITRFLQKHSASKFPGKKVIHSILESR